MNPVSGLVKSREKLFIELHSFGMMTLLLPSLILLGKSYLQLIMDITESVIRNTPIRGF
jgi:hypothetical protein